MGGDLSHFGLAKEGDITRQVMLGVVQTVDGLPIYHEVFTGNAAETHTLVPTIKKVLARYPIRRVVLLADVACCRWTTWRPTRRSRSTAGRWNSFWRCWRGATATSMNCSRSSTLARVLPLPTRWLANSRGKGTA